MINDNDNTNDDDNDDKLSNYLHTQQNTKGYLWIVALAENSTENKKQSSGWKWNR